MNSIRRTLLLSLLGAIVVVLGVGGFATYRAARDQVDTVMDYHLRQFALSMRDSRFAQPAPITAPERAFDFVIQIWDRNGLRLYLSHPHTVLPDLARFGYADVDTSAGQWRVFSMALPDRVVQIAQPMRVRSGMAARAALSSLTPLFITLPLLGALIWYLVGRSLRPLNRLTRAVASRRPDALAPLPTDRQPEEVRPLVDSLNGLLSRLDHALSAQRAFVADAAHELRTPLTALQLQLQLTERASSEAERAEALQALRAGLDRSIHLVTQLLTLARAEPDGEAPRDSTPLELAELVRSELTAHAALADARQIDLGATRLDAGTIAGDPAALRIALANLITNALRYVPQGGRVDVAVRAADNRLILSVSDNGPGIPAAERPRVLDRFYRRADPDVPGSGLGLAIVKAIATRHQAELLLEDSDAGGLRVSLVFALASAASASAAP